MQHTWLDGVGRCIPSSPLENIQDKTTSGVACHYRPWEAYTVGWCRAWHSIIALGKHTIRLCRLWKAIIASWKNTRSDNVQCRMTSSPLGSTHSRTHWAWYTIITLGQHTRSDDVERGMPLYTLESIHDRTTSSEVCYYCPLTKHTIGRRCALYARKALRQHTRSDDVGRGIT